MSEKLTASEAQEMAGDMRVWQIVSRMSSSGLVWRGAHRPVSWGTFIQHFLTRLDQQPGVEL